jgi:hypothetical protein
MKSLIQIVVLLAVLIGGVFGVTFLTQYTRKPATEGKGKGDTPVTSRLLEWPLKTAPWGEILGFPGYASLEIEKGSKDHYDFLLRNVTEQPVKIVRDPAPNCTCTNLRVFFGVIPDAAAARLATLKSLPVGPKLEPHLAGIQWKQLDADANRGSSAPETLPASQPSRPTFGVIRFDWEAVHEKTTTVNVNIVARQGPAADYMTLQVPLTVCPPVYVSTENLALGDINAGETKEESLIIWSPTRNSFKATAQLAMPDPCIQISPPRPFTKEELAGLPAALRAANGDKAFTQTKCAYAIKVTAHERLGDNQLELGPLARRLVINQGTDTETPAPAIVTGTVRGPIQVGKPSEYDRVDFRVFRSDQGAEKSVEIRSSVPGLVLSIDRVAPDSIKTQLLAGPTAFGARTWKLTVVIPPDTQAGPLPADSAIYLKTNSTPPRRIRIPITGNASG